MMQRCVPLHSFAAGSMFSCGGLISVITTAMSAVISADRARVWRALVDPHEIVAWDTHYLAAIDVPADYPQPGQHVRWRYRLGSVPAVLHDKPQEVLEGERLVTSLIAGSLRLKRTYSLVRETEGSGDARTRVTMKLVADNTVPLIGGTVDRFDVRRMSIERIDKALRALQSYCESRPQSAQNRPPPSPS